MVSPSSHDEALSNTSLEALTNVQQAPMSKTRSNKPIQKRPRMSTNLHRELLLANLHDDSRSGVSSDPKTFGSNQHRSNLRSATSPGSPSCSGALPFIPEILVKSADIGNARANAGGSVSPSNHPQSPGHLQVPRKPKSKPKAGPQDTPQSVESRAGHKKTFRSCFDRALGLYHVRAYGDHERLVGGRYRAKRNVFRVIALVGLLMTLSLGISVALFIYFASNGRAGPEWFAWIGVSAVGWIWSFLAFIMVKRSKKRVLHDVEIARQSIRLSGRVCSGTAAPTAIFGGPSANMQQVMRAGSAVAVINATSGAGPSLLRPCPGLRAIPEDEGEYGEENWALDAEERLDMLVTIQRSEDGKTE
ncbi:hypothetical protein CI238_04191 [Colletotrichum incanum]|uniref:Uncharacterized protein n=1 Tax=Colletotrichum incanum TaxID=1573173 RepID=A0A167CIJ6_COLIC|nr:hypothetical protein CI238_04191 [Colletotrichum incanum]